MASGQLTYAATVRPGDHILEGSEFLLVNAVRKAQGRKPKVGENLHFVADDDRVIKVNSSHAVRVQRAQP